MPNFVYPDTISVYLNLMLYIVYFEPSIEIVLLSILWQLMNFQVNVIILQHISAF